MAPLLLTECPHHDCYTQSPLDHLTSFEEKQCFQLIMQTVFYQGHLQEFAVRVTDPLGLLASLVSV